MIDANACVSESIDNCCTMDSGCDDGKAGTTDTCDLNSNTCINMPTGCLVDLSECNDDDVCTTDSCGDYGTCSNAAIAGCCAVDDDCEEGQTCGDGNQCEEESATTGGDTGGDDDTFTDWGPRCTASPGSGGSPWGALALMLGAVALLGARRVRIARSLGLVAIVSTIAMPMDAHADWPDNSVYLDIYGGGNFILDSWDLHKVGNNMTETDHGGVVGLRLGGYPVWWLGIEGGLGLLPLTSEEAGSNIALDTNLGLLFHFTKTTWSPYLTVGGAFYRNVAGDLGKDVDYAAFWGLGVVG